MKAHSTDKHYRGMPTRIRIGNVWFTLKLIDEDAGVAGGFFGAAAPSRQTVLIAGGQSPANLADTFIHEVLHCILWLCKTQRDEKHDDEEEFYVTHLAHGLCRFWQDNPQAAAWWARVNSMEVA
ncbi:hypothetical protein ACTJLD_22065 [Burkholderia sp. 22088]|uniref:hypothetical protein n=1 Tax=Burkholderia sp. 22088 TaxID=3453871 RepID=UPI003F82637A